MKACVCMIICALLQPGCRDTKDWDEEIILMLFKPRGVEVGQVVVTATQPGTSGSQRLDNAFTDCSTNRVRVIPRKVSGGYPDVTVTVAASLGNLQPVTRVIQVPASNPVTIVLGTSQELDPSGPCTPVPEMPDAGPADAGPADAGTTDGPIVTLSTGSPCVEDKRCKGGVCLQEIQTMGVPIAFPGGYCSRDCTTLPCPQEEFCKESTDGNGSVLGKFCLQRCKTNIECRVAQGYTCTTAEVCMPK